jgi:hypothetical protein
MKKNLFLISFILVALNAKAQTLNQTGSIATANAANNFTGGYTFSYRINAGTPWNGSLISFGGLANRYDTQINADYGPDGGNHISFRTKNGDANTWNSWVELASRGVNTFTGEQVVNGNITSSITSNEGGSITLTNPSKTASNVSNNWKIYNMTGAYGNGLQFWSYVNDGSGGSKMTITDSGNVGIGTSTPTAKLEVNGNINVINASNKIVGFNDAVNYYIGSYPVTGSAGFDIHGYGGIRFGDRTSNSVMQITNGNVGIGTASPNSKLEVNGNANIIVPPSANPVDALIVDVTSFGTGSNAIASSFFKVRDIGAGNNIPFIIRGDGNVGIGTASPDTKLAVNGTIHTKEVRVDLLAPMVPDYVFANNYKLKTLEEVDTYIKANSHLPEIPSAKEIEKNGLMLGEMNMNLLKKIEELTLYMIEMKKDVNTLKEENVALKTQLNLLKETK